MPTPPEGHVKVRSALVTRPMLRKWGFEVRDCPTGHGTITTDPDLGKANVTTILAELRACGIA